MLWRRCIDIPPSGEPFEDLRAEYCLRSICLTHLPPSSQVGFGNGTYFTVLCRVQELREANTE